MNQEQKIEELQKQIKWNKKHLRIVFVISSVTFLMLVGHFILHGLGKL